MITLLVYNNINVLIGNIGVSLYHLHHQQSIADSHSRGMCLVARLSIQVKTDIEVILALDLLTTLAVHMIHLCKGHHSFQKYHPSLLNGKCVILIILKIHCSLKYNFYLKKSWKFLILWFNIFHKFLNKENMGPFSKFSKVYTIIWLFFKWLTYLI